MSNDMKVLILVLLLFAVVFVSLLSMESRDNPSFRKGLRSKENIKERAVVEHESKARSARSSDSGWEWLYAGRSESNTEDDNEFEWDESDWETNLEEEKRKREEELAMKSLLEQFLAEASAQEERRTRAMEAEARAAQEQVEQLRRLEWLELNRQQQQAEALQYLEDEMQQEMDEIRSQLEWAQIMAMDAERKAQECDYERRRHISNDRHLRRCRRDGIQGQTFEIDSSRARSPFEEEAARLRARFSVKD